MDNWVRLVISVFFGKGSLTLPLQLLSSTISTTWGGSQENSIQYSESSESCKCLYCENARIPNFADAGNEGGRCGVRQTQGSIRTRARTGE